MAATDTPTDFGAPAYIHLVDSKAFAPGAAPPATPADAAASPRRRHAERFDLDAAAWDVPHLVQVGRGG